MNCTANITVREIDNGFVVTTRGAHLNRVGESSASERFYPDFEALNADSRAIFEAGLDEAKAEMAHLRDIHNQRSLAQRDGESACAGAIGRPY